RWPDDQLIRRKHSRFQMTPQVEALGQHIAHHQAKLLPRDSSRHHGIEIEVLFIERLLARNLEILYVPCGGNEVHQRSAVKAIMRRVIRAWAAPRATAPPSPPPASRSPPRTSAAVARYPAHAPRPPPSFRPKAAIAKS